MSIDLQAMLNHAGALQRATSLAEVVQVTYEAVRAHTRYQHAWLGVVHQADPGFMYVVEVRGLDHDLVLAACPRVSLADDAMVREIIEGGAPVVIAEASEDPRTDKAVVAALKNRTLVNVAMAVGTERMGTLGCGTFGDEGVMLPTEAELEWLVVLATQLGSALMRLNYLTRQQEDARARVELERSLEALQRLELMGVLAAGVAHDLNNYLTVVRSSLDLLDLSKVDPEAVQDVLHATTKASEVTAQLLTLGRSASPKRERVDLNARVESTLKLVRSSIPQGVQVTHTPRDAATVNGDAVQIEQALANLVINARDAVGERGAIEVGVKERELNSEFVRHNTWAKTGRFGLISVHDSGPGIAPELLSRIYDPLFTTKSSGTGLGLAVVSRVAQQHQGMVHVESRLGAGTTFELYLPA
jgi:signal transduction histidine kinase